MGFPIAFGTKSVASRPIPAALPLEEFDHNNGGLLLPSAPSEPLIVAATSADQELLASITLYYYNMFHKDDGRVAYSVAELHIQISLLAQSTSLSGRDMLHRIPLPGSPANRDSDGWEEDQQTHHQAANLMVTFSADRRYLTCLIPHPSSSGRTESSSVIVFQLRRPKGMDPSAALHTGDGPPLPAYVAPTLLERPIIPVATNPTILLSSSYPDKERPLLHATSVCDVETSVGPLVSGLLLVGCRDGSVQVATYRPAVCCGVLHPAPDGESSAAPIVELDHWTEWRDLTEKTMVGRLAVVFSNGRVRVFRSHFAETDDADQPDNSSSTADRQASLSIRSSSSKIAPDTTDFSFGVIPTHEFPKNNDDEEEGEWNSYQTRKIVAVKWIAGSYLAVHEAPDAQCTVRVMGLYDYGKYSSLSTMIITREQLDESAKGVFRINSDPCISQQNTHVQRRMLLEYDTYTDCLAISSFLQENDNDARKRRFVCLWNWRMNILGLMASLTSYPAYDSLRCSTLHFGIDHVKRRKIILVGASATTPTQHHTRLYKETYDVATLSPSYETTRQRCKLRESHALLLSAESVSFPYCTKTSPAMEHFEIEWIEAAIPTQYLSSFGAPSLAAIGKELGRSIAVASARGFCVLDRTGSDRPSTRLVDDETSANLSRTPRWRLFANETHERAFRVLAMTWWEGLLGLKSDLSETHAHTDDFLVAIIEVLESLDKCQGYYLSCWSGRDVELTAQLLRMDNTTNGVQKGTCWGIPLPHNFLPGCIDLLACPFVRHGRRYATVLIADSTYSTNYFIHQLQVVATGPQAKGSSHFEVQCHCIAHGNIGSPSELFLASSSFSSVSLDGEVDKSADFAVLGVLRKYGGGLDALSVCSSNIVSVGQVIESADRGDDEPRSAEISRYWLADVVLDQNKLYVWTMQLACGRLVSWSIPFLESMDELDLSSNLAGQIHQNAASSMVHKKSSVLGFVCPSGTVSNWMQQSSQGAQRDFFCGSIPRSSRGCVLGVSQNVKSFRTSLPLDSNELDLPSSFLDHAILSPSDVKLYPPAFLPSLFVLANETTPMSVRSSDGSERFERHLQQKMKSVALRDMSVMSIQLIILRLVEKLAVISKTSESKNSQKYALLRDLLITVVASIRNQTTALQFASFFLQLGRHVEPSCLPHLFPLPESVEDLLFISAKSSSVNTAVFAIPLLSDQRSSFSLCTSLFHYCLNHFDASFGAADTSYEFAINIEELEATGGLFRYALKGQPRRAEVHLVMDDHEVAPTSRYSIMCGLSNIFGGSRNKLPPHASMTEAMDDSPLLVHGISDDRISTLKQYGVGHIRRLSLWKELHPSNQCLGSVPALASRYVVATLFGGSALDSLVGWIKVAALATVLMQDVTQPENCGTLLTHFMRHTKVNRWVALVPVDIRRGGMTHVLEYCLGQCRLDAEQSGRVLDFLLVLLQRCDTRHLGSDRPGLLLAAVAAAHVAERIPDILDPTNDRIDELSAAYFELFPTSSDSSTNDDRIIIV
jgi:hypothetical protein